MAAVGVAIAVPRVVVPVLVLVSENTSAYPQRCWEYHTIGVGGVGSRNMQRAHIVIECGFYTH